jgi:hypothetical protein
MKNTSTPVTVLDAIVVSDDKDGDRSICESGLVHQISLSNLVGEIASLRTTDEIIRALVNYN